MITKKLKWIKNGITFNRGNHECLIAQFNQTGAWFTLRPMATQQTQKSEFRRLAEYLEDDIIVCEVKHLWDEHDAMTESVENIIVFDFFYDGSCHIYDFDDHKLGTI